MATLLIAPLMRWFGRLRYPKLFMVIAALFVLVSRIGNLQPGYLYGIVLGAIFVTVKLAERDGLPRERIYDLCLWLLLSSLVGSRGRDGTIIDFDLEPMLRAHRETGAVATIAAMVREPDEVAEKYGVMLTDTYGRVQEFVEKPTLAELREHFQVPDEEEFRQLPLRTNAGFYLVEAKDLDEAIAMAKDIPSPGGGLEVRPVMVFD